MPNPSTSPGRGALRIASADAAQLPRIAAAMAAAYMPILRLPDAWSSTLERVLVARAADAACLPLDQLLTMYGKPGAWLPRTYRDSEVADMRYWLDGLQDRAAQHLVDPPASS